jgi:DnaJ-class molecular chaperone
MGRGKTYEKLCTVCRGGGKVLVTEKFRIRAEKPGDSGNRDDKDTRRKFGIF